MQALRLPADRGVFWLFEGFKLFRKRPVHLSFLVMSYWLLMLIVSLVPLVGQALTTLLIPVFSVSLMNACQKVDANEQIMPVLLFSGFKKNLNVLLLQGMIYLLVATLVLSIVMLVDGGTPFFRIAADSSEQVTLAGFSDMGFSEYLIILTTFPILMAYWYSPVLTAWHNLPAVKALFFSLIACLRNWQAFAIYLVTTMLMIVAFVFLVSILAGGTDGALTAFMIPLFLFVFLPTLYASFYVSYREVFITENS